MKHERSVKLDARLDARLNVKPDMKPDDGAADPAPASSSSSAARRAAAVQIWTDGACKGNPGPGGWGALLRHGSVEKELFGGAPATTNNRMELTAVIEALGSLKRPSQVVVHTDSQYVQLGISEWMRNWIRRGWRTAEGKPVKNADLWQQLNEQAAAHEIEWRWVKGHAGVEGNERADELANRGVESVSGAPRQR